MAKGRKRKGKHIPQRTCVGCRLVSAKRAMIRIIHTTEGVLIDPTGKEAGRGAYLHENRSCWERGLKGALTHALKTELTADDNERLRAYFETLPEDSPETQAEQHGQGLR